MTGDPLRVTELPEPSATNHSPGLGRALRATASPRRSPALAGHQRTGALRERRRLITIALALALGALVLASFYLWESARAQGLTYSHWGPLGRSAGDDYDEGAYVISAQLLLHGYRLFHDVFSAQPAFFLPSLAGVLRIVGNPATAGHIYEALFGLAVLGGVFWMGWTAYRPLAAPLAAMLLAVSPGFLLYAHAVEAEVPMLGLCTLAVAAAQAYYLSRRRVYAALSGLLFLAGSEMKLLSVVVALPLALFLLGGVRRGYLTGRAPRSLAADLLAFVLCCAVPALVVLALLSPADQWRQVISFHLAASKALPYSAAANRGALVTFLGYDPGLLLVAAIGAVAGIIPRRSRYLTAVFALWFLSTLAFLYAYHPLLQHQFVPLLPPLALLGAAILAPQMDVKPALIGAQRAVPASWYGLVPAGVFLTLFLLRSGPIDGHLFTPAVTPRRDQLAAFLDRATQPTDFVVCDDPMVALRAHRLLPPGLEDPSMVRTAAGYLTAAHAEAITLRYHAAAIVASRPMFANRLPAYLAWARRHYRQVHSPASAAVVFLRR